MAAIDKIYGTTGQYSEFYTWCKKHKPSALKHFYLLEGYEDNNDRPITNFPVEIDKWMLQKCPIRWVTDAIRKQYRLKEGEMIK